MRSGSDPSAPPWLRFLFLLLFRFWSTIHGYDGFGRTTRPSGALIARKEVGHSLLFVLY